MDKKQIDHETTNNPGGATKAPSDSATTERTASAAAAEIGKDLKQGIEQGAARGAAELRQSADDVVHEVKQVAVDTTRSLRDKVGIDVRERVDSGFSTGRDRVVSEVGGFASALKSAGKQLRDEERGVVADYTEQIGDRIDRAAHFLKDKDAADLMHEVEAFARRRPTVFLAGAVGLGLLAARFLKSSSR